jgi:anaerobic selenocysteine-containing dehydrogenase
MSRAWTAGSTPDLILIWHGNPRSTRISSYHFISEARYKGAEVITIAPDFSPSAIHADRYLPVGIGTDSALALGACQVILAENLANLDFIREQTDLPLLVRTDTGRYLRESDRKKEGGREDQLYWLDEKTRKVLRAPLQTLATGAVTPALEGTATVGLADGTKVEVEPVLARLRRLLDAEYTPEKASAICGTPAEEIRRLARKVASKKTHLLVGWNAAKFYHGDLMERSQCLLLALTGNWGKQGTGTRGWNECGDARHFLGTPIGTAAGSAGRGPASEQEHQEKDPTLSGDDPTSASDLGSVAGYARRFFYWYNHAGYDKVWPTRPGATGPCCPFGYRKAVEKGWWTAMEPAGQQPRCTSAWAEHDRPWAGDSSSSAGPSSSSSCPWIADRHLPLVRHHPAARLVLSGPALFLASISFNTFTDQAVPPIGDTNRWEMFAAREEGGRARRGGGSRSSSAPEPHPLMSSFPAPCRGPPDLATHLPAP